MIELKRKDAAKKIGKMLSGVLIVLSCSGSVCLAKEEVLGNTKILGRIEYQEAVANFSDIFSLLKNGIEGALSEEAEVRISRANTVETFATEGGTRKFWYDENGYLEKVTWNALDGTSFVETLGENDSTRTYYFADGSIEGSNKNTFDRDGNMSLEIYYKPDGQVDYYYQHNFISDEMEYIISYDGNGEVSASGERRYDKNGNIIQFIWYDPDGRLQSRGESEYDAQGNEIKSVEYDSDGRRTEHVWESTQREVTYRYDENGVLSGGKMVSEYDLNGNQIKTINYDANNDVISLTEYVTDASGNETIYSYDSDGGYSIREYAWSDKEIYSSYRADGSIESIRVTDGDKEILTNYDAYGNVVSTIEWENGEMKYSY